MTLSDDTVEPLSPTAGPSSARHDWRPLLVRLHFYAGVLVGPFLIVAAVIYAIWYYATEVVGLDALSIPRIVPVFK